MIQASAHLVSKYAQSGPVVMTPESMKYDNQGQVAGSLITGSRKPAVV